MPAATSTTLGWIARDLHATIDHVVRTYFPNVATLGTLSNVPAQYLLPATYLALDARSAGAQVEVELHDANHLPIAGARVRLVESMQMLTNVNGELPLRLSPELLATQPELRVFYDGDNRTHRPAMAILGPMQKNSIDR